MEEGSSIHSTGPSAQIALRDFIKTQVNISDPGPPDESGLVPCPTCGAKLSPQAEKCGKCQHPITAIRRAKRQFRFERALWFWCSVLISIMLSYLLFRMFDTPLPNDPFRHLAGKMQIFASYVVGGAVPLVWINYWFRYGRFKLD